MEGPCTKKDKKKCLSRNDPSFLETICKTCAKKNYEPNPYVINLHRLYMLQEAGFPMDADTLELDGWMDLAIYRTKMNARRYSPLDHESGKTRPPRVS